MRGLPPHPLPAAGLEVRMEGAGERGKVEMEEREGGGGARPRQCG